MKKKLCLVLATAAVALVFGGTAMAQGPGGVQTGGTPQHSDAMVTLGIPTVVGVNVGHNFVLDFAVGAPCWGTSSTQGTFPQSASVNTTYTFAVTATDPVGGNVGCPAPGANLDVANVQVLSTATGAGGAHLQVSILDGGQGAQGTLFSDLITDILTGGRLTLDTADSCANGGGVLHGHAVTDTASDYVTGIPPTAWANCRSKLSLTLAPATTVKAGTATGTMTFTIVAP